MSQLVQDNKIAFREDPSGSFEQAQFDHWKLAGSWQWTMAEEDWGLVEFSLREGKLVAMAEQLGEFSGGQHDTLPVLVLINHSDMYEDKVFMNLEMSRDGSLTGFFQPTGWDGDWDQAKAMVLRPN